MHRSLSSSEANKSFSRKKAKARGTSAKLKTAQMEAALAPVLTLRASARPPKANSKASIAIDLPAPVSPVIALIPLSSRSSVFWTTA